MGIVVNKNQNDRSAIQARINADLRARLQQDKADTPVNDIEQSDCLKNSQKTSRFAWLWAVLIIAAIVAVILIVTI